MTDKEELLDALNTVKAYAERARIKLVYGPGMGAVQCDIPQVFARVTALSLQSLITGEQAKLDATFPIVQSCAGCLLDVQSRLTLLAAQLVVIREDMDFIRVAAEEDRG